MEEPFLASGQMCHTEEGKETLFSTLTLRDLTGIFFVAFFGSFVSSIAFALECLFLKLRNREQKS